MQRESFIFYRSFAESLEVLNDKQYARVFRAITKFALNNEEPELTGVEKAIFSLVKPQLVANQKRYENGCRGGRKPNENQNETEIKPNINQDITNSKPNDNVNDNVNVNLKKEEEIEEKKTSTIKDIDVSLQNFLKDYEIELDSYNSVVYQMDFEKLSEEFNKSAWLKKNIKSFKKVCELYHKIVGGYYRDYQDVDGDIIIPQERWCVIEKIIGDMKYNSENYSRYDDYDKHKAKQLALYDGLTPEEKAYFGDYNSFYNLLEYKSLENEKARFMRDFEKFVKKWRKKNVSAS